MKRKISAALFLLLAAKAKPASAFHTSISLRKPWYKPSEIPNDLYMSSISDGDCQENGELATTTKTTKDGLGAPFQNDNANVNGHHNSGFLSDRGSSLGSIRDDLEMFQTGLNDSYHPITNPNGYLVMLVAENKLLLPELNEKLRQIQIKTSLPNWIFGYGDFGGDEALKEVIAKNVMERFVGCGGATVDPQALRFQAGAGSVLNLLSLVLGDAGDGVLVAGPTYPAFPADFELIGKMKLHVFATDASNGYVPTLDQLEQAYVDATNAGNPPKILLLCQPDNPTGVVYSRQEMITMIDWALSKPNMHVVSDEIYALSVFPGVDFTSAAQIMHETNGSDDDRYLGDRVHIVYGLSKDWGMSGLRVGTLFSHNEELLTSFDALGYYQGVSQHTQYLMIQLFSDTDWIEWYIRENQLRLLENYNALEEALQSVGITIPVPAKGSHFAWADFSCFLNETADSEKDLWLELFHDARVLLTTGESCFEDKPGMFRVVHPWPEGGPEAMAELKQRLIHWKANREKAQDNTKK